MPIQKFEDLLFLEAVENIETPISEWDEFLVEDKKQSLLDEIENYTSENNFPDYLINDPQIVGYPDLEIQEQIYEWVNEYLPPMNFSVKDFGAGRGDFYGYLSSTNRDVDYYGFDLNPNLVNVAKSKYPDIQIFNNDYLDISIETDYTVVIGTLNENHGQDKWDNFNKTLIHAQNTTNRSILFVLQADCYENESSCDFPINDLVKILPKNIKFTIDNSKIEDIYILVVHIAD